MNLEDARAVEDILSSVFALFNVILNSCLLFLLYRAWGELKKQNELHNLLGGILGRMDKLANENIESLSILVDHQNKSVLGTLEKIYRRQHTIAELILDDRKRLLEHVERVKKLQDVAEGIEKKFLQEER